MRPMLWLVAFAILGCLSPAAVTLDRYRGVYSTHFDGIPDQTGVCAILTNRGEEPVRWISLRMHSFSELGDTPADWTSHWLFTEELAPGESVAVDFLYPPNSDEIELQVSRTGTGPLPRGGRTLRRTDSCSEPGLRSKIQRELAQRKPVRTQLISILRRGEDEASDLQIASGD